MLNDDPRTSAGALAGLFALVSALAGADLVSDMGEGASAAHVATEAALLLVGLVGLALMLRRLVRKTREAHELAEQLDRRTADAKRWRAEAQDLLQGLSAAIDQQLERWSLTPAEKEVAILLLKGLSHKEIASVRGISDATARQQARAVYKKAGLSGRHDLSAFFLEDLLLPPTPPGITPPSAPG